MGDNEYIYVYIICYCYPVYHCMLSLVYMLMGRMAYCINNNKLKTKTMLRYYHNEVIAVMLLVHNFRPTIPLKLNALDNFLSK